MEERKNKYEVMIAVRPDLAAEGYEELEKNVRAEIEKQNGEILDWQIWADKRNLAYPLQTRGAKKVRFNEATYILTNLLLNSSGLARLKYVLDLDERVFRFLVVRKKKER